MIIGLSVPAFTLLHVIISLIAIGAGFVALLGMANGDRLPGWTALFLLTTALTSITGFLFRSTSFGPPHAFGVITLVVLVPVLLGLYVYHLRGRWRLVYLLGAALVFWLNAVVAIIQFFQKVSFLHALAPTQSEPLFVVAQVALLGMVAILVIVAALRFKSTSALRMA